MESISLPRSKGRQAVPTVTFGGTLLLLRVNAGKKLF
jgi:hypothetical protein